MPTVTMRKSLLVAIAATLAVTVAAASPAAAKGKKKTCPTHPGTVYKSGGLTLWTNPGKTTLNGCYAARGYVWPDHLLGSWSAGSKLKASGQNVIWTTQSGPGDALWAADVTQRKPWLHDVRPVFADATDNLVQAMVVRGSGEGEHDASVAGWITTKGTVMMAVSLTDSDPATIGAGTPGAAAPAGKSLSAPRTQGLNEAPKAQGTRVFVGRWGALDVPTLAATLAISPQSLSSEEEDDAPDCEDYDRYAVTVTPVAGQPPVGVQWLVASYMSGGGGVC